LREDGRGLLINVSRGLARAEDPGQVAAALRDEMFRLAHTIRRDARAGSRSRPETEARERIRGLADDLLDAGCIQFGEFTLKSGLKSPFYIDLRRIVSYPSLLDQVSAAYLPLLAKLDFQRIAGLPYAALPIATAISLKGNLPLIYPRREAKDYGTRAEIEGVFQAGETVVVIDDLATTGASKFEAIEKLSAAGLRVRDVVVLIDRQSGAKEALEHAGLRLHSVVTIRELLDAWESTGRVPAGRIEASRAFLDQENASHA
jgi:uridine monophosphate synthetase